MKSKTPYYYTNFSKKTFFSLLTGVAHFFLPVQATENIYNHLDLRDRIDLDQEELEKLLDFVNESDYIGHIDWGELPDDPNSIELVKKIEFRIAENNKNYQSFPSDFVHGLLSSYVYQENTEGTVVEFVKDDPNNKYNQYLKGWKTHKVFDIPDAGKYYSVIYVNEEKKQVVAAYRGTSNVELTDLFAEDSMLRTDLEGVFMNSIVNQQVMVFITSEYASNYARKFGYQLSTTGHSLGAWLAELSAYHSSKDFKYTNIKTVTFDSPGSSEIFDKLKSNVNDPSTGFVAERLNIVTYLSAPNIVNSCNGHVGKLYRVFPGILQPKWQDQIKSYLNNIPIGGEIIQDYEFVLNSLITVSGHSLNMILEEFNSTTGKPNYYERVLNWPRIKYDLSSNRESETGSMLHWIVGKAPSILKRILKTEFVQSTLKLTLHESSISKIEKAVKAVDAVNENLSIGLKVLKDLYNGHIDISQYFALFKNIQFGKNASVTVQPNIGTGIQAFSVKYEGSYDTEKPMPMLERLLVENVGSIDWYIFQLTKTRANCFDTSLDQKQYDLLSNSFTVDTNQGHILTAKNGLTYENIVNWVFRIISVNINMKRILGTPEGSCLERVIRDVSNADRKNLERQIEDAERNINFMLTINNPGLTSLAASYYKKADALAKLCFKNKKYDKPLREKAWEAYNSSITLDPNNSLYLIERATFLTEIGLQPKAVEDMVEIQKSGGRLSPYIRNTLNNLTKMQDVQNTISSLEISGKIDPEMASMLRAHADVTESLVVTVGMHESRLKDHQNILAYYNHIFTSLFSTVQALVNGSNFTDGDKKAFNEQFNQVQQNLNVLKDIYDYSISYETTNSYEVLTEIKGLLKTDTTSNGEKIDLYTRAGNIYRDLKDNAKALECWSRAYAHTEPFSDKEGEVRALIDKHDQDFFRRIDYRFFVSDTITIENELMLQVKSLIQESVLNKIYTFSSKGSWDKTTQSSGVVSYLKEGYIKKRLESWSEEASEDILEIVHMLSFEAINLGIMHSKDKNFTCAKEFAKAYPQVVNKVAEHYPDFFVDCKVAHHVGLYIDNPLITGMVTEESMVFVDAGTYSSYENNLDQSIPLYSYQSTQLNCIGFNFSEMTLSGSMYALHDY